MKKIFKFALASVAVTFAGFGIYQNMPQEKTLSDFALENIEALTNDEHTRVPERLCKRVLENVTCYYYVLDSNNNICDTGEKRPYAADPLNLMK